jgi:hypothetical protein
MVKQRSNIPATNTSSTTVVPSEVKEFRKGIKRDANQYPVLKNYRNFDNWRRKVMILAQTHQVSDVFTKDPKYVPISSEDVWLLEEKQMFAFIVLEECLQTDRGKPLLQKYHDDNDAQYLWIEFNEYMKSSTKAEHAANKLLSWIPSSKYENNWHGSSENFILYWMASINEYDTYCSEKEDIFSDKQKLCMLQNAVDNSPDLRQVRINAAHAQSEGRPPITYQKYIPLLLSAAEAYDNSVKNFKTSKCHQVLYTDINYDKESDDDEKEEYNVDTYFANLTSLQQPIKSRNSKVQNVNRCNFLAKEDWLQIPEHIRAKLVNNKGNSTNGKNTSNRTIHNTNVNELELYDDNDEKIESSNTTFLDAIVNNDSIDDNMIQQVMKSNINHKKNNHTSDDTITIYGTQYRKINVINIMYRIHAKSTLNSSYSLVNRGANGGLFGADVRVLNHTMRRVTITGIYNHQVGDLPICTGAGFGIIQRGPFILIVHQYAYLGQGKTFHSSGQLESFKNQVDDRSRKIGGTQRICTPDRYFIPLKIIQGLPHFFLRPPTDKEMEELPHVVLTSDCDWEPSSLDNEIDPGASEWYDNEPFIDSYQPHPFTRSGSYKHRAFHKLISNDTSSIHETKTQKVSTDFESLRPRFGCCSTDTMRHTFDNTTQLAST